MDVTQKGIFMTKKKLLYLVVIVLSILVITLSQHWRVLEYYQRCMYDFKHSQKDINSQKEINAILEGFKVIKYQELNEDYKIYSKSENSKYKSLLENKRYFQIGRNDFYKHIVGSFRIEDLLAKDKYYKQSLKSSNQDYFWLIDKELLYKLLELRKELESQGFNKDGFVITNGHRHPRYNEKVGGAKLSRHIKGEAIDIHIKDIDRDKKYTKNDKDIVIQILEDKVIKDQGGIGLYPGTRSLHFDVRGYRARWNSY